MIDSAHNPTSSRLFCLTLAAVLAVCVGCPPGGGEPEPAPSPFPRELLVANMGGNSIVAFALENDGTLQLPPTRVIHGPNTGLHVPMSVSKTRGGEIFVANMGDVNNLPSVTIYAPDAIDNAAPTRTIQGSRTGLTLPNAIRAGQWNGILVTNHVDPQGPEGMLGVIELSLDPAVVTYTGGVFGTQTTIEGPMGIARDLEGRYFITEPGSNRILGFQIVANQVHNEEPDFVIEGPDTLLDQPMGIAFDGQGLLYVVNRGNSSITVYPEHPNGNVAPLRRIGGPGTDRTLLVSPEAITVDDWGRAYVSQVNSILVFDAGVYGNVEPAQRIDSVDGPPLNTTMGLTIR